MVKFCTNAWLLNILYIYLRMCCKNYTIREYIESASGTLARIELINQLIDNMLLSMLDIQEGKDPSIEEYQMNDGQVVVRTRYKTNKDLEAGIASLERLKQTYKNRLNGNVFLLRNVKGTR